MNATAKLPPKVFRVADQSFAPRFEYGDQAQVSEVCGTFAGSKLGAGFVRLSNASIPWTTCYDEVVVVLEGEIAIRVENDSLEARTGDCIWLPEGTALVYETEKALVFYATHPADWAERVTPR